MKIILFNNNNNKKKKYLEKKVVYMCRVRARKQDQQIPMCCIT